MRLACDFHRYRLMARVTYSITDLGESSVEMVIDNVTAAAITASTQLKATGPPGPRYEGLFPPDL